MILLCRCSTKLLHRFRWVALQIDQLKRFRKLKHIRKQLEKLPKDLEETYERILTNSEDPGDLRHMLHWLTHSTRALSLAELAEVLSVDLDARDGLTYDFESKYGKPEAALDVCSGLVIETGTDGKFTVKRSQHH